MGLHSIQKALDSRADMSVSTESLLELVSCVLKNNVFEHNKNYYKQQRYIGSNMAFPYAVLIMS